MNKYTIKLPFFTLTVYSKRLLLHKIKLQFNFVERIYCAVTVR